MKRKRARIIRWISLVLALMMLSAALGGCMPAGNELASSVAQGVNELLSWARSTDDVHRADWTVMMYFCGSDLESAWGLASENLAELCSVSVPSNVNVLIETGGASSWSSPFVSESINGRYEVRSGVLHLVDRQPASNMGEARTLGSFIKWGQSRYPAKKYMLLLWDHGGGSVSGVCFDELNWNDSLDLNELSDALSEAREPIELIGFDTCLSASLEIAATVAPYAKYMVASEEIVPGRGWSYDGFVGYIAENPGCDGEELGRVICDTYYNKCTVTNDEDFITLSLLRLDKIDELLRRFEAMALEMTGVTGDITSFRSLSQAVGRTENYGGNSDAEGYTNMIDLGDLVVNAKSVLPETGSALLKALFDTVAYQVKGANRMDANGISVYYPLSRDYYELDRYAELFTFANYLRYFEYIIPSWVAPDWVDDETEQTEIFPVTQNDEYKVEFETFFTDSNYVLEVTNGAQAVESVQFALYYVDYEYNEHMLLGYDNDLFHDWEHMMFSDNMRGVWPAINGLFCSPTVVAAAERYNIYSIPIMLNGEQTNLRAAYIWNADGTGYFKILGVWDGIDTSTGMSARGMRKLAMGDEITPIILGINLETGEEQYYSYGSFIYEGEANISEEELDEGDYVYHFIVRDIFGNTFTSERVNVKIDSENIRMYTD